MEEGLGTLLAMGFEENMARNTLMFVDGDVEAAVMMLLSGEGVRFAPEVAPVSLPPLEHPIVESTLIKPYGAYVTSICGYCKREQSASHFAFTALRIRPEDYDNLLDQWCLSAKWMYHPLGDRSCCSLFAIRLPISNFDSATAHVILTREKMQNFLSKPPLELRRKKAKTSMDDPLALELSDLVVSILKTQFDQIELNFVKIRIPPKNSKKNSLYSMPLQPVMRALKVDDSNSIFELLFANWKNGLIRLDDSKNFVVFESYERKREVEQINLVEPPPVAAVPRTLDVDIEEMSFSQEKFHLYQRYERFVHDKDETSAESFTRNYCESPVMRLVPNERYPLGLGPLHMTYRLNGELIGCAMIMILPETLASVYFWWDKERFASSSLGNYSQIEEIELIRKRLPHIQYYNLMWHCPTSSKMAYKLRNFPGSEICCPLTLKWTLYTFEIEALISERGYCQLISDAPVVVVDQPIAAKFDYRVFFHRDMQDFVIDWYDARLYLDGNIQVLEGRLVELAKYLAPELRPKFVINLFNQ